MAVGRKDQSSCSYSSAQEQRGIDLADQELTNNGTTIAKHNVSSFKFSLALDKWCNAVALREKRNPRRAQLEKNSQSMLLFSQMRHPLTFLAFQNAAYVPSEVQCPRISVSSSNNSQSQGHAVFACQTRYVDCWCM